MKKHVASNIPHSCITSWRTFRWMRAEVNPRLFTRIGLSSASVMHSELQPVRSRIQNDAKLTLE